MNIRTRKFIGVIVTVTFLCLYSLVAMVIGAKLFIDVPAWVQLPAFTLLGIAWLPVIMKLIRWMQGPGDEVA